MKWLALLLLCVSSLFVAPRAEATTTCSITGITGLSFGAVDPTGGVVNVSATLNYRCVYSGPLAELFGSFITACASFGTDDLGNLSPRTLVNPSSDRMQYQVYQDAVGTVWGTLGNATYGPRTFILSIGILSNGAQITGSLPVYGRVSAAQGTLSPGNYTGTLTSSLTYSHNDALLSLGLPPATCTSGGTGGPFTVAGPTMTVTASVAPKCTFGAATDLLFGNVPGLLTAATDQTSLLRITCTNRAAYQLGLDNGANASGTQRRMAAGGAFVNYELYKDSQRTLRWGGTLNSDTLSRSGTGTEETVTVYGRVPAQAAVAAGNYSDLITVTVTY
ncbi:spore coat U domain-containing protein [Luteibacter aegosomatis]|uniref:Csu type fimbrial protein n=1 Tax=Luteibacter aegosomatis TaxID=2911537 RepID=UPI001FF9A205|nr:spore coat protein U domain-containing protein [Luteibacter aegosomatis]UPG86157.1 spore coat U domain-containing protein [Luteibacter aegosomatis]